MSGRLDTQPSAVTYDLEELVGLAWDGDIRIPHFQRDFRWNRQDVIRLFDSILKGYPVGSLLLWVRPAAEETVRLGALRVQAPKTDRALWVVDGQQRIISLANALHERGAGDPRFALVYDLRAEKFTSRPATVEPWMIPLPVVFDLQQVLRWFADHPDVDHFFERATAVTKTLRQFKIPAYLVRRGDVKTLTDIFDRMNNFGKRLSRAEIFSALFAGDEGAAGDALSIARIAEAVDIDRGFGRLDDDTVLRAILARRGPDVAREIRNEFERRGTIDFPGEDRDAAYRAGEDALRRAVSFLQDRAGVPHLSMLAYRYPLIVLSRLFAHHPEPDERSLQLLRRWYWRAAVIGPGYFSGHIRGATRTLGSKVRPDDLVGSIQGLLQELEGKVPGGIDLKRFQTNQASAKITLCAWWDRGPRSPLDGEQYAQAQLSEVLAGRDTAADAVRYILGRRQVPERYRLWAANRMLLPSEDDPVDEIAGILAQPPSRRIQALWPSVLRSHCLTGDAVEALANGKTIAFLEARQASLSDDLTQFLRRMCEWEFEDTPSLDDLIVEDVEDDDEDIEDADGAG